MPEIKRRLMHMSGVTLPMSYFLIEDQVLVIMVILFATLVATFTEIIRLRTNYISEYLSSLVREYEKNSVAGYYYYIIGMLISWIIFEPQIAFVASLCLAISDPIGGIILNLYDNIFLKSVGVFLSSLLISSVTYLGYYNQNMLAVVVMIITASLCAVYAEYVELRVRDNIIDDNFLIPILTGIGSTVSYYAIVFFL
jgi:dolichol kinase